MNTLYKNRKIYLLFFIVVTVLLVFYILAPQYYSLREGLALIPGAEIIWLVCAVMVLFGTYFMASLTLHFLSVKKLQFRRSLLVQFASGFAGKLIPAGIGGMALNVRYLNKNKHTLVESSSIIAINAVLGLMGHVVILILGFSFAKRTFNETFALTLPAGFWLIVGLFVVSLLVISNILSVRKKIIKFSKEIYKTIQRYERSPSSLIGGFLASIGVTVLFTTTLYLVALSLDIRLGLIQVLMVYTAGAIGSAITPTPGGIGGAEAALTGALIVSGIATPQAFSIAITYRLITFWLPIIPGLICFNLLLRRRII